MNYCTPQCEWQIKAPWGFISRYWSCLASPLLPPPRLQSPASNDSPRHLEFNVISWGNPLASPVFLAHGRQDCAVTFQPLMQLMPTEEYYYVSIDMPGSGNSDPFPNGVSVSRPEYEDVSTQLQRSLRRKGIPTKLSAIPEEDEIICDEHMGYPCPFTRRSTRMRRASPDFVYAGKKPPLSPSLLTRLSRGWASRVIVPDIDSEEEISIDFDEIEDTFQNSTQNETARPSTPDRQKATSNSCVFQCPHIPPGLIEWIHLFFEDARIQRYMTHQSRLPNGSQTNRVRPSNVDVPTPPRTFPRMDYYENYCTEHAIAAWLNDVHNGYGTETSQPRTLEPTVKQTYPPGFNYLPTATHIDSSVEAIHGSSTSAPEPSSPEQFSSRLSYSYELQRQKVSKSKATIIDTSVEAIYGSSTSAPEPSSPEQFSPRLSNTYKLPRQEVPKSKNTIINSSVEAIHGSSTSAPEPSSPEQFSSRLAYTYKLSRQEVPKSKTTINHSSVEAIHGSSTSAPEPSSPEQFSPRLSYTYELPRQEVPKSKAKKPENPGKNICSTKFSKQCPAPADRLPSADISLDAARYEARTVNASAYVPQASAQKSRPSQSTGQYFAPADQLLSGDRLLHASKSETQAYVPQDSTSGKFSAPDLLPSYYDQSIRIWLDDPLNYAVENAQAYLPQDEAKFNRPSQSSRQLSVPAVLPPDFDQSSRIWLDDPLTYEAENVHAYLLHDAAENTRPIQSSGQFSGLASLPSQSIRVDPDYYGTENAQAYVPQDPAKYSRPCQSSGQFSAPAVLPSYYDQPRRIWLDSLDDPRYSEAENAQAFVPQDPAKYSRPCQSSGQFSAPAVLPSYYDQPRRIWLNSLDDPRYSEAENAQAFVSQDPAKYSRPCQSSGQFSAPAVLPSYYESRRTRLDSVPSNISMSTDVHPGMYLYGASYGPESFNDQAYGVQNFPVSDMFPGEDLFEISEGVMVMRFHFVAAMEAAIEHLGWKKFIFVGHSMGAEVGLFYNCVYPGRITKMVLLDPELTFRRLQTGNLAEYQHKFYDNYYDNYWKYNNYFKTYTIPEATKAIMRARNLTEDKASIIVKRSLKHVKDDKYRFTWDRRLKMPAPQNYPNAYYFALFSNIPPSLIISATDSLNAKSNSGSLELLDMVCSLKNCRHIVVEGSHDVHLSHPERIGHYVADFLRKKDSKL